MLRFPRLLRGVGAAGVWQDYYGKNFTVTPRTWTRIVEKNDEEGIPHDRRFLRLAIDSGGCHGFLYKFSFEMMEDLNGEEDVLLKETDVVAPEDPVCTRATPPPQVVVDTVSLSKLQKAILDYYSELKGSAFVVIGNELVDQSCACALSFSLKSRGKPGTGQNPAPVSRIPPRREQARYRAVER